MFSRLTRQAARTVASIPRATSRQSAILLSSPRIPSNPSTSALLPLAPCRCFSSTRAAKAASPVYTAGELTANQYQTVSDRAMDRLTEYLEELVEESEGSAAGKDYDVEYSVSSCGKAGVLTFKLTEQDTYVINKQPPNKQIWLSSPISGPKRYDYDPKHKVWFYSRDNTLMRDLLNAELKVLMSNEAMDVDLGEEDDE